MRNMSGDKEISDLTGTLELLYLELLSDKPLGLNLCHHW